jgi:molybdenum cofactor cytidylyltransferase
MFGVLVLAAGASRRLGQPKQLLPFREKPMLQHVLDQTRTIEFATRVLVLGACAEEIRQAIAPGAFDVVWNESWEEGMSGSIRVGVERSLALDPSLEHLLVLLCDQPYVTGELLREMMEAHLRAGKKITACRYQDTVGVPAIFSKGFFPALLQLRGDRGAGGLIKQYPDDLTIVPFDRGAVDVDTPEDYEGLFRI